jgi:hypothetical protein
MKKIKSILIPALVVSFFFILKSNSNAQDLIRITTPLAPPQWALLERQALDANSNAISEFYNHFYDARGYYLHVPRWGALDGTDDVIEIMKYWTLLHAMGASDKVLELYRKALEGTYRQYGELKTTSTEVARLGSFYKEFMPQSDFMHQAEGYQGLMFQGLSEPDNYLMRNRYKRFAGFYLNEDPEALNYDPEHKIIKSFWTGSRGPMLRESTAYDWAGDRTEGTFNMLHHKDGRTKMLDYGKEYQGIIDHYSYQWEQSSAGDHPLNLNATQLALNAYMLDHEKKYRDWVLEYAGAWKDRAAANGGNFPTDVGPDGKTGTGVADKWYYDKKSPKGKWYMGTYGWNFAYYGWNDMLLHSNQALWGIWPGMGNAYMLTGDIAYVNALRKQMDNIYANKKTIDGREMIPLNYGIHIDRDLPRKVNVFDITKEKPYIPDGKGVEGWYNWTPNLLETYLIDIYLMSADKTDLARLQNNEWISFLEGKNADYPVKSLNSQLDFIRNRMEKVRNDPTTPDTRLADWALDICNPVNAVELVRLIMGGNLSDRIWSLHARVRYFDPERGRAGLPDGVAALVTKMDGGITGVTLVNIDPVKSRSLYVQTGAYGEHECLSVKIGDKEYPVNNHFFKVQLDPGAGAELIISTKRYANQPVLTFPW